MLSVCAPHRNFVIAPPSTYGDKHPRVISLFFFPYRVPLSLLLFYSLTYITTTCGHIIIIIVVVIAIEAYTYILLFLLYFVFLAITAVVGKIKHSIPGCSALLRPEFPLLFIAFSVNKLHLYKILCYVIPVIRACTYS